MVKTGMQRHVRHARETHGVIQQLTTWRIKFVLVSIRIHNILSWFCKIEVFWCNENLLNI